MDMNGVSTLSRNDRVIPSFAQRFHILLVVHNIASLMFLASRFEKQQYQVTTAESASGALAIMEKRNSNFDIVIADLDMPGMAIYEFVRKVHHQSITTIVILIAEDVTPKLAREAMRNGVCFLFSKAPSDGDIVSTWQHVGRVTGELPALTNIEVPSHLQCTTQMHLDDQDHMATEGALQIPRSTIWPSAPKFAGYTIEYVEQQLDAYYSDNNITKAISSSVQGEEIGNASENAYVTEEAPLVHQNFSTGIEASDQLTNDLQDPNQDPTGDFEMGALGSGNADNLVNMSHVDIGGGSSGANQQYFSEMPGEDDEDDVKKIIQELVASGVDLSDLYY